MLETTDYSRAIGPKQDYTGASQPGTAALPLPVSIWYPAQAGTGEPMVYGTYLALAQTHKRGSFGPISDADREAATNLPQGIAQFAFGEPLTAAEVAAIMEQPASARRDADAAPGSFPLILASLYGTQSANLLAEHLASHGYVVATGPMRPEVGRQQVTVPQLAMETQSRNLEFMLAQVRSLPYVNPEQMGLLGLNFDGFSVINVQMRNMQADAVVSLDGWQDKGNGTETMRASPYFDVLNMRVPYLGMTQANPPQENYAQDFTIFNALRYADRHYYLVRDFEHHHFIGDLLAWPHLREEVEPAYAFVYGTVRHFFDAYIRGDADALIWLQQPATEKGFAPDLIEQSRRAPALPPVPTRELYAQLLEHDLSEAVRIFRTAHATNPDVDLVSLQTLNLMAFRARRREDMDDVVALNQLKTEAFPASTQAFYDLGTVLSEVGREEEAAVAFRRALALLDDDPEVAEGERDESRQQIEARLGELGASKMEPVQLTYNDHADFHPSWSPDGLSVLYDTIHDERASVALLPIAGGTPQFLAQGDHPLWFSDGQRFLFVSEQSEAGTYSMILSDRQTHRLVDGPSYAVPSPDGRRVAYISNHDGYWDLFVLDLATDTRQRLTENGAGDFAPSWSPNSNWMVFMSQQDEDWNIYLVYLESRTLTALTTHLADDTAPQWSPDGSWISLFSDRSGTSELYLMRPDGSGIQQWTHNHAKNWHVWSPDGSRIAFVAGEGAEEDLFLIDVQSGAVTPVVVRPGRDVAPAWSPDGQRLVFASDHDGDLELYLISLPH